MLTSLAPRHRLLLAGVLLLGLAALAPLGGLSPSGVARGLLGGVAIAGGVWWLRRRAAAEPRFALPERLRVISRAGLSQRCGIALVEADGRSFLVVFGDAFAEIRMATAPKNTLARARRPVPKRRASLLPKGVVR